MMSAEENPGLIYFLGGIILLVMAGVAMSLVVDRRMQSSRNGRILNGDVKRDQDELASMRTQVLERGRVFEMDSAKAGGDAKAYAKTKQQLSSLKQRRDDLEATRMELSVDLPRLDAEFGRYRDTYRTKSRAGAIGESLGTLRIRGGREFQDVVLTKVTDVGMEIRHSDGIARVQAPDLDEKWHERFQWTDEARRAALKIESENHRNMGGPGVTPQAEIQTEDEAASDEAESENGDPSKLEKARAQVVAWRSKVNRLSTEKSEAFSQSGYGGRGASVPGTLETWQAKAARLGAELIKAKAELSGAKGRLEMISPGDLILREPSQY